MKFKEIQYFRTDGKNIKPSGVYIAKGLVINEMKKNANSFIRPQQLLERMAENQFNLSKYNGGIVVFATSVNTVIDNKHLPMIQSFLQKIYHSTLNHIFKNRKLNKLVKQWNKEFGDEEDMFIGAFIIGNFFKGRYIGDNGEVYNDTSASIDISGVPSELLLIFASKLCKAFKQETVLVKDFNNNKIYLVNDEQYDGSPSKQIIDAKNDLND